MCRVMIAGTGSGCGKTMLTCGLLYGFQKRGLAVSAYKCGPDYIDSAFHSRVLGIPTGNLDSFFTEADMLKALLVQNRDTEQSRNRCQNREIKILEGVMGYYDGLGASEKGSSFEIAAITETPVILVINAKGMGHSVLAILKGFLELNAPSGIRGVIFNRLSERLYPEIKEKAEQMGVEVLGYVPFVAECSLDSRHLGLVGASEIKDFKEKLDRFYEKINKTLDWEGIYRLASEASELKGQKTFTTAQRTQRIFNGLQTEDLPMQEQKKIKIAAAKDEAFCFIYEDNLNLFRQLGCEIAFFSPLTDKEIPKDADALLLSGGYPELYAKQLSENISMRNSVRHAIDAGIPTVAECGGYLYLLESLQDMQGNDYPMAGVLSGEGYCTEKLQRFGYVYMTALVDNLLCQKGEQLKAHEFHYYDVRNAGGECHDSGINVTAVGFHVRGAGNKKEWEAGCVSPTLYAGFPHFYFYGNQKAAQRFVVAAQKYRGN